jgi:AGZA family xanthine/uracil permease-like MFS transporter
LATAASRRDESQAPRGFLDRFFKLTENGTNVRTEVIAGLTTFVTMAYIIIVNPSILKAAGMDEGALFMATVLAAAVSTLVMGLYANWPFALAPGMGLNAFFAFVLVGAMKVPWQTALGVVLLSGLLALVVTATGLREIMIRAIPQSLKHAVGAGIGLFIMLIGLKNAGIVQPFEATIISLGNLKAPGVLLAIVGLIITAGLVARQVRGGILIGIVITTILGIPFGVTQLPGSFVSMPPSMAPTFMQLDLAGALNLGMITVIFSLFFADLFDTIGTFVGTAGKAGLIDKEGNLKGGRKALVADSTGTIIGALFGTSNTTTYVESAAGIAAGGRTGLTAVTTACLFLAAMFLAPIALAVPAAATAPALIIVGIMMASALLDINLHDFTEAVPAVVTAIMMPFSFSIATGLALGFVTYVLLNLVIGRAAKIHWMMYVLSAFFIYYFYAQ